MIKTLSPYNIYIPFVNPDTGVTCEFFTIQIFAWNGLINVIPLDYIYEITIDNQTSSNELRALNIAELISDTIDFKAQQTTPTSIINGNNQNWFLYKIKYNDSLDFKTIETKGFTLGYSWGMDGENQETPINKILLKGNEFKVNRNGFFTLPIEAGFSNLPVDAVDEIIDIFFEDTLIDVLQNDLLGFLPTNIISFETDMLPDVGTLSIEDNKIKFTKGASITTPQTFTYTIKDSIGQTDTATVTININSSPITIMAINDSYNTNNEDDIEFDVMANDFLGTTPTNIVSIDNTGFTLGTLSIVSNKVKLVPNANVGTSTFKYTIEDSTPTQSEATVTVKASAKGGRYLVSISTTSSGGGPNPNAIVSGTYADDLTVFFGNASNEDPLIINRCVIESSLTSNIPAKTVYNFNDSIVC